jgi:hypothetical protein
MAGNRWGGFSGRERAPKSLTSSCVSSTARPDCSLQGATPTLGHVWTFKHSAAGVVTMICSPSLHRSDALLGALQERTGPRRHLVGREARTRKPARFLIGGFGWFPSAGAGPSGQASGQASDKPRASSASLGQAYLKPPSSLPQAYLKPRASCLKPRGGGLDGGLTEA